MPKWMRKFVVYGLIIFVVIGFVVLFFRPSSSEEDLPILPISQLLIEVSNERIHRIDIDGNELEVTRIDGSRYLSEKEDGVSLFTVFAANNVDAAALTIEVKDDAGIDGWLGLLLNFLPLILIFSLIFFLVRKISKVGESKSPPNVEGP